MNLKWTFPPTAGGIAHGFNDSAQEFFRNDAWKHTIREMIQNSLDAVHDESKPVTVELSEMDIPSSEIGAADLRKHVRKALERTNEQGEQQGEKFYSNALDILSGKAVKTLAVRDTNTTGLVDGRWDALVYHEGTTNKGGMSAAGGSFGLGKNAPYLVSDLKAVGYSTRYLRRGRQEDFIARCKLVSHDDPNRRNRELQHVGFGTKPRVVLGRRALPTRGKEIYKEFRLPEAGSAIFIIGFNPLVKNWEKVAKKSVAENFFASVHEKKLQIRIGSTLITHETLDDIFEQDRKNRSFHYYHILRNRNSMSSKIKDKLGSFSLKFSIDEDDLPNRIAYVNRRGMLITDTGQRGTNPFHKTLGGGWASYAAVLRAADDATDKKIREMEPPNHGTIECGRIIDPSRREKMWRELDVVRDKIATAIGDALRRNVKEYELNVSELAPLMPIDDSDDAGRGERSGGQEKKLASRIIQASQPGTSIVRGAGDSNPVPNNDKRRPSTTSGTTKTEATATPILEKVRILRVNGKMRLAFTPVDPVREIHFMICPAGEERLREHPITVTNISVLRGDASARVIESEVIVSTKRRERVMLDIVADRPEEYTGYEVVCVSTGEQR